MADEDSLDLGRVRLTVLETPGHTVESISILVFDLDVDARQPQAILTGDTLFVGDVGRPDLRASLGWSANDLGKMLYHSVRDKLLPLPDATLVYPAHGAGSLCGKQLSKETVSTIGEQRRTNYALQPMSEPEFIELVTADQPDAPSYFTYDAVLNTKERPTLSQMLEHQLKPLDLEVLQSLQAVGAQVLDVRDPVEYSRAHMKGSLNIGLGGSYATWAGTVLDRDKPIVIVAEPGRQEEAAMRLGRIGFDSVVGYLARRHQRARVAYRPDDRHDKGDAGRSRRRAGLLNAADCPRHPRAARVAEIAHRGQREYPVESPRRADRGSARQPARARALRRWVSLIDRRGNPPATWPRQSDRTDRRARCLGGRRSAGDNLAGWWLLVGGSW
jgi:rhodanese-related sulfurtransferase